MILLNYKLVSMEGALAVTTSGKINHQNSKIQGRIWQRMLVIVKSQSQIAEAPSDLYYLALSQ